MTTAHDISHEYDITKHMIWKGVEGVRNNNRTYGKYMLLSWLSEFARVDFKCFSISSLFLLLFSSLVFSFSFSFLAKRA